MPGPRRRLSARRSLVGHTQESLAHALGLGSTTTVARWEQGLSTPHARHRPSLAGELQVSLEELHVLLELVPDEPATRARLDVQVPPERDPGRSGPATSAMADDQASWPAPLVTFADLERVHAARDDARYVDGDVIEHYRARLIACAGQDRRLGPRQALPAVLEVVGTVGRHAKDVSSSLRRELLVVGARGAELLGWLYRDIDAEHLSDHWRDRAFEWAAEAGDLAMCGYVLLRKSQAAWDRRDAVRMLSLAEAARRPVWGVPGRVSAEAAQQEARGRAMIGEGLSAVDTKLGEACQLLAAAPSSSTDPLALGAHYDEATLSLQMAICYTESGRARTALHLYEDVLDDQRFARRDYGYFLALMAETLVSAQEPGEAARTGLRALELGTSTASERTLVEVQRLSAQLAPWNEVSDVRDLREMVAATP